MVTEPSGGRSGAVGYRRISILALLAITSLLIAGARADALRLPGDQPQWRVLVKVMWGPEYLNLAAEVPDPILIGTSLEPMTAPEQDDGIEFDFEVRDPSGSAAHRLLISAAGGMTLLTRDMRGDWRADQTWIRGPQTLKYVVVRNGSLDNSADEDVGYVIECAIPWAFLGGAPVAGGEVGFNVVCRMQGDSQGMVSWSPAVRTEDQVGDAARWGRMVITLGGMMTDRPGQISCPLTTRMPFIDGKLSADEWLTAGRVQFARPEPTLTPIPAAAERTGVVGSVLAVYRYDWQGNLDGEGRDRSGGARLWRGPDLAPATSDQPLSGAGPWYSYERVSWHQAQLQEVQRAGIDIILCRYRGDPDSQATWATRGLDRLSEALRRMRAEGRSYPLVGMMLDTGALAGVDLTTEPGKQRLYGMVRDFFLHVPSEFRAELGTGRTEAGAATGVPVLLGEPEGLAGWDGSFPAYCEERFAEDFDGVRIAWLGSSEWRKGGADSFHAYVRLPTKTGFTHEGVGATAVAVSPGYREAGGSEVIRPRREGAAYRTSWQRALAARPELVLINSWNDFATGTEVAPTRQHGVRYVDATRYHQALLGSQQPHQLRLKKHTVPATLKPDREYLVEFLLENVGSEDIRTGPRITVDYVIARGDDGVEVQRKVGAQGLHVLAGQTLRLPVNIITRDDKGKPLPPGDYRFSLVVIKSKMTYLRSKFFADTIAELTVPITIGDPPPYRAYVISSSLLSAMDSGGAQQVVVRMRNDGAAAWEAGQTQLSCHWLRCETDRDASLDEMKEIVAWDVARARLLRSVAPGEVVSVMVLLPATREDGSPLPPLEPGAAAHYRVQWDLVTGGDRFFSRMGAPLSDEPVQVESRDSGVLYRSATPPTAVAPGESFAVPVVVANAGSHTWSAGESSLIYRWCQWDGRDTGLGGEAAPLPADVNPGEEITVSAEVTAPEVAGPYRLTWDMVCNGEKYSETEAGRRAELLVSPVLVKGARFSPLDLSSLANVAAVTVESRRSHGDFDGRGRSLPAEWLPPDASAAPEDIYPSGYCAPRTDALPVPFVFGRTDSGVGGAVACNGQSIALGEKGVIRLHLLAASTGGEQQVTLGLGRADGVSDQVTVTVPGWLEPAAASAAPIGLYCPYIRTATGDDNRAPAYLYHLTIAAPAGEATRLELPRAPWIKILAITREAT